ncbi:nicotinamide riboside kinase 1-like isoform X2 [Struthio camelus]|uniref:nicotinamide riboside kinase 1-like isoform X2 n=1 Tax=Struthio camelus TaxID=8801 RepID=UPI003603B228
MERGLRRRPIRARGWGGAAPRWTRSASRGVSGVTNGGKTTLAEKLKKILPNCDIISQDDFFKLESEVETDQCGFKLIRW